MSNCLKSLILLVLFAASCTDIRTELNIQKKLALASYLVETNPDSSYVILREIDTCEVKNTLSQWMEYRLCLANVQNRLDMTMPTSSSFMEVAMYYESNGEAAEQMLAQYLMGRIYNIEGESPMAIRHFQKVLSINESDECPDAYRILYRAHAQIADVYLNEKAYEKVLEELDNAAQITLQAGDTMMYRYMEMLKIKPMTQMGRFDEVIKLSEKYTHYYLSLGDTAVAALVHQQAMRAYMERGRMADAHEAMLDFEDNSGLFDKDGKIQSGREVYYYTKGCYYLKLSDWGNADHQFRRLMDEQTGLNSLEAAYRGLLMLYTDKGINDSIGKYAILYGAVHDTLCKHQTTREVAIIQGMFDYSRHQAVAEDKGVEVRNIRWWLIAVIVLSVSTILLLVLIIRSRVSQSRKAQERQKDAHEKKYKELENVLKIKDYEIRQYILQIQNMEQRYQKEIKTHEQNEMIIAEVENTLLKKLRQCGDFRTAKGIHITESEWKSIFAYIGEKHTNLQKRLEKNNITDENLKLAALYALNMSEDEAREILGLSPSAFSNRKTRLNKKLFNEKSAATLRRHIQQLIGI